MRSVHYLQNVIHEWEIRYYVTNKRGADNYLAHTETVSVGDNVTADEIRDIASKRSKEVGKTWDATTVSIDVSLVGSNTDDLEEFINAPYTCSTCSDIILYWELVMRLKGEEADLTCRKCHKAIYAPYVGKTRSNVHVSSHRHITYSNFVMMMSENG